MRNITIGQYFPVNMLRCFLRNFRAAVGGGMHFSAQGQALAPEKCARPAYTPPVSIENAVLCDGFYGEVRAA